MSPLFPSRRPVPRHLAPVFLTAAFVLAGTASAEPSISQQPDGDRRSATPSWTGPDDRPLPFTSDEEILDFLATAEVVESKVLSSGSTKPLKVLLEKDGVRANAVFRNVEVTKGIGHRRFRDSFRFEVAAYELSRLLGLDNVPPAVVRILDGNEGSMQLWVEGARSETDRIAAGDLQGSASALVYQKHLMRIFDRLIYNFDRNTGNVLVDEAGKLWMIDHTRSFKPRNGFPTGPEIVICDRGLWNRLKGLDTATLERHLSPHLDAVELDALVKRHRALVSQLERLIAERGEDAVLFDLT